MKFKLVVVFFIICLPMIAIAEGGYHPTSVMTALEEASDNRNELETVLDHYIEKNETLKLLAAYYLIENMSGHRYVVIGLYDSSDVEIEYDVLAYPDFETLISVLDSIEVERGELHYDKKETQTDLETITADYVIENIDLAFRVWREKPWAQHLTFQQFCYYVLPHRGSSEPLESWRTHFWKQYQDLPEKMTDPTDPMEAAQLINNDIRNWFSFDERFYVHPTDQGLSEMLSTKMGRCEDMTNLAIYAMRANGIAVTSDYTPHWADTGNNHAWNTVIDRNGKPIIFMGGESNPGEYRLRHRMAKVYRKMYHQQKDNLAFQKPEWEDTPAWLSGKSYLDVTTEYTDVCDVNISLTEPIPDSTHYAYLCVFNSGEWRAIHWGEIDLEKEMVIFTDMGKDIAYLPMYYVDEELIPAANPFILKKDCTLQPLIADHDHLIPISVVSTTRRKLTEATDGIEKIALESGVEYEFFYWQNEWVSVATQTASDKPLIFENVPANGLYWVVAKDSRKEERIFTINDDQQVWW